MRGFAKLQLRKGDVAILLLILAWVAGNFIYFWSGGGTPARLVIESPTGRKEIDDLARGQIIAIQGRLGVSRIEIRDGRARFIESPCPGKLCIHAGWIAQAGDVAACLPNGVVIALQGANHRYDTVNY